MRLAYAFVAALLAAALPAAAAEQHEQGAIHTPAEAGVDTPFGTPGDPGHVTRTVAVRMTDQMRFTPSRISVRRGETIRFRVTNAGALPHEMVLGTRAELARHAAAMRSGTTAHDPHAPGMLEVPPGATGELVWSFTKAGRFDFACLVPGHLEAGMAGTIDVR